VVEITDHKEWQVLQRLSIVEKLLVGCFEILVMTFVLPAEVSAKPDVCPAVTTIRLGRSLLEGVPCTLTIGIGVGTPSIMQISMKCSCAAARSVLVLPIHFAANSAAFMAPLH
jgi:hypothetical protein